MAFARLCRGNQQDDDLDEVAEAAQAVAGDAPKFPPDAAEEERTRRQYSRKCGQREPGAEDGKGCDGVNSSALGAIGTRNTWIFLLCAD